MADRGSRTARGRPRPCPADRRPAAPDTDRGRSCCRGSSPRASAAKASSWTVTTSITGVGRPAIGQQAEEHRRAERADRRPATRTPAAAGERSPSARQAGDDEPGHEALVLPRHRPGEVHADRRARDHDELARRATAGAAQRRPTAADRARPRRAGRGRRAPPRPVSARRRPGPSPSARRSRWHAAARRRAARPRRPAPDDADRRGAAIAGCSVIHRSGCPAPAAATSTS